ncbi:hypothetical protein DFS34DRAFT_617108 [Phlyctochytrium arcticum]|nr:hypothetical protein DFS34DRAFT_617108 [Phlyctochytrium arcticum]
MTFSLDSFFACLWLLSLHHRLPVAWLHSYTRAPDGSPDGSSREGLLSVRIESTLPTFQTHRTHCGTPREGRYTRSTHCRCFCH